MTNIGVCRFCGDKNVELQNSHVFSEFLYKSVYDEKNRALNISPNLGERDEILQKGIREYLFCAKCEQHLSNYESYAARIIQDFPPTQHNKPGDIIFIPEVDYQKFKLFQMSLLWRASVTSRREFSEVSLGRHHEERLSRMLVSDAPGEPWEYGCILTGFSGEGELNRLIKLPNKHRLEGHIAYSTVFVGLVWTYVVSSHARIIGQDSFLQKSGVLPIHIVSATAEQFSAKLGAML